MSSLLPASSLLGRNRYTPRAQFLSPLRGPAVRRADDTKRQIARHLILVYRIGWQAPGDLHAIADMVREIDPSIEVFVTSATSRSLMTRRKAANHPTLVVSAAELLRFAPSRGKVMQGAPIPKFEELRRLVVAGVPVPRTAVLTPDLRIDPDAWGPFVVVKPTDIASSSHGHGVHLMRAQRVRYRLPREYPEDHPGRNGPMLVQQYIDTGREPGIYRVLMFLGRPLYAYAIRGVSNAVDLNADDATLESAVIASQAFTGAQREFVAEADVLDIARQADAALPEIPLKGCDVIREAATGRLYILEVNAGGNTWHFSSGYFRQLRRELGSDFVQTMHAQFDAFRTAAAALVERVNSEAE